VRGRVLSPEERAAGEVSDEDIRDLLASGAWTQEDLADDLGGSASPQVKLDVSLSARLADGRHVGASGNTLIGTGITEAEATADKLREVLELSVFRFSTTDERWGQLVNALAAHGVDATASELDNVEREVVVDLGHL
jgi:hypothetical protein